MQTLGERIEFYRKRTGISRKELAKRIGVHINTLGHWIRDEKEPGVKKVQLLAFHLKVDPTKLITEESATKYAIRHRIESFYLSDEKSNNYRVTRQEELEQIIDKIFELDRNDFELVKQLVEKLTERKR